MLSKKEKEIIEDLKECENCHYKDKENCLCEVNYVYKRIILGIIEKQQKEINEKDKLLKFNRNYINKLEQDLFENASNYVISKEAIREKIKEIDENGYWDFLEERDCEKTINILKELLGDE